MRKPRTYIAVALILAFAGISSCEKEVIRDEPTVTNPYDDVDYGGGGSGVPVDSTTFLGVHQYIFSTTCAVPACHDGSFEPDFRTVQSAYNTLVYAPTVSNNQAGDFTYRVVPGDTGMSWMHERITTDDPILGRMPLYDELTPHEIWSIEQWILDGAKDIFGNSTAVPNFQPTFFGVLAYENDTTGMRLDTIRDDIVAPIQVPQNTNVQFWIGLYDSDIEGNFFPSYDLTYNKMKISPNMYDFSAVPEMSMDVENALTPFLGPIPFSTGLAPYYQNITINTSNYPVGQPQFMRVYVQDANHSFPTEIPESGSQVYLLTYFSFVVQ